jgi:hypothetical protein
MARTATITESVQTDYNGIRYRSRREARWAIFLDVAGIRFQYEPRVLAIRGHLRGLVYRWLPDFYLAGPDHYAEVKGFMPHDSFARLTGIARGCDKDIVVLGHANDPWIQRWPCQLRRHRGELIAIPWSPAPQPVTRYISAITPDLLLKGFPAVCPEWAEIPLAAARRYRFPPTAGPQDRR